MRTVSPRGCARSWSERRRSACGSGVRLPRRKRPLGAADPPWGLVTAAAAPIAPKWCLATSPTPSDIRPAVLEGHRYADWEAVTEWVRGQVGQPVQLTPISAIVWHVREGAQS